MPATYWSESEFLVHDPRLGELKGTCGPNSLAMAECWAEQRYIGVGNESATEVVYRRMVAAGNCNPYGGSVGHGVYAQAVADGYIPEQFKRSAFYPHPNYETGIPRNQWVEWVKEQLQAPACVVMEVLDCGPLTNSLSHLGEDGSGVPHYICICKYHPGGWAFKAGRAVEEGFWVADGDSNDTNPLDRFGNRHRVRNSNQLQFYSIDVLQSARPCYLVAVYPKGAMGMAEWTDDGQTLTAPNGNVVVQGFRWYVLSHDWDADDVPLEHEHPDGQGGAVQLFTKTKLTYDAQNGVRRAPVVSEWQASEQQLAGLVAQAAADGQTIEQLNQQIASLDTFSGITPGSQGINRPTGPAKTGLFNPNAPDQTVGRRGGFGAMGMPPTAGAAGTTGMMGNAAAGGTAVPTGVSAGSAYGGAPSASGTNQDDSVTDDQPLSSELQGKGAAGEQVVGGAAVQTRFKITPKQMPETYLSADRKSLNAQRLYRWAVGGEQSLLILAALAGFLPAVLSIGFVTGLLGGLVGQISSVAELVVTGALAATVAIRVFRSSSHPDVDWFDARILAEEVMSQSWRYAMGATPYEASSDADDEGMSSATELRFMEQIERLRQGSSVNLDTIATRQGVKQLPDDLKGLRDSSLQEKVQVYLRDRLEDQAKWYRKKAVVNQRKARFWNRAIFGIEGLALIAAAATHFGLQSLDVYGLAGTIIAGAGVWLQMQQYATLARRYSSMARNLEGYVDVLKLTKELSPQTWAQIVDHVEGLMEREHQGWLTLYQHLRLPGQDAKTSPSGLPDLPSPSQVRQTVGASVRR